MYCVNCRIAYASVLLAGGGGVYWRAALDNNFSIRITYVACLLDMVAAYRNVHACCRSAKLCYMYMYWYVIVGCHVYLSHMSRIDVAHVLKYNKVT